MSPRHEFSVFPGKRRYLTPREKMELRRRQHGRCSDCRAPLKDGFTQYDHMVPVKLGGASTLDNFQALCTKPCHAVKTKRDVAAIAKAKRTARKMAGDWKRRGPKLRGRGFNKTIRHKLNGKIEKREGAARMS